MGLDRRLGPVPIPAGVEAWVQNALFSFAIAVTVALWSVTFASECRICIHLVEGIVTSFLPDHGGRVWFQQSEELVAFLRQLQIASEL